MSFIEFRYNIINTDMVNSHLELKFEMTNFYSKKINFSRRGTPFDTYLSNCFIIKYNNDKIVTFDGLLVSRPEENNDDILCLEANESKTVNVKISASYKFCNNGLYELQFNTSNFKFLFNITDLTIQDLIYSEHSINIKNKHIEFILNINSFINIPTIGDEFRSNPNNIGNGITFSNNATVDQKNILVCLTAQLINFYTTMLNPNNQNIFVMEDELYYKWFGLSYNNNKYTVNDYYMFTFERIISKNIFYNIDNSINGHYAETVPNSTQITIYPLFWQNNMENCFYSQFGILIHEFSHIACSTSDDSTSVCKSLEFAQQEYDKATKAANNYQFYIEDLLWHPTQPRVC